MSLNLKNLIPKIIENANLWNDLLDVTTIELLNLQNQMEIKKRYLNPSLYDNVEDLVYLSRSLGYTPNLSLREDLDYVQQEISSIVFKIKNKATYNYYRYLFKLIPKEGDIYIIYKDYMKLLRIADISQTFYHLETHDFTQPFVDFLPIDQFDQYRSDEVELDANPLYYLDSGISWYLDQDLVIKPTKHLAVEYKIDQLYQKEGKDYLITKEYFIYLDKGLQYGRKVVDIPHPGANLSIVLDNSGVYDNQNPGSHYSVPSLKLKSSTTSLYTTESTPKYICFGNGTKELYSQNRQSLIENLVLHLEFEDENTITMQDESPNNNDADINGSFVLINEGVSGQALHLNGIDTEGVIPSFLHNSMDNKTITFWIKPDRFGQLEIKPYFLYQTDSFWFYYDTLLEELFFGVSGDITDDVISTEILSGDFDNKLIFVCGEIDNTNHVLKLYINNVLQETLDISHVGSIGGSSNLYIGSSGGDNYYRGSIDSIRLYNILLSENDKTYLYTNKPGSLRKLSNLIFTSELSTNQYRVNENWFYATSTYPANTKNGELIGTGDGNKSIFSGILNLNNIKPKSIQINYFSFPNNYTVTDNGNGILEGVAASGTINYKTGEYVLNTKLLKHIDQEILVEDVAKDDIQLYTENPKIYPETFTINFRINEVNLSATDDGNGEITGTGITSGTINYTTGYIDITFVDTTSALNNIYCSYDYIADSTPDNDIDIEIKYQLDSLVEITEAGVFDEDKNMLVYSTFPPCEFENTFNHLSVQFFVRNDY